MLVRMEKNIIAYEFSCYRKMGEKKSALIKVNIIFLFTFMF